jgi:translation initiation factor 5A
MAVRTASLKDCKPGSYIMIEGEPCRVVSMTKSKPGKHGSAKVRLDAMGIFDSKKRSLMKPADSPVDVPIIEKKKAQVINVSGGIAQLMDMETYETFEALVPEEFRDRLEPGKEIVYWKLDSRILIKQLA